jgi:hypothetical protein
MTAEAISMIIAAISAIVAVMAAGISFYQTRKSWYLNVVSPQRLEWAQNLREAITSFADAFYSDGDILSARVRIDLYLQPTNKHHKPLIECLDKAVSGDDVNISKVVIEAQRLLRINWWTVKAESTISYNYELRRDKLVDKRIEGHTQRERAEE